MESPSKNSRQASNSAESSSWQDLKRMGGILLPTLFLLFLVIMVAIGYTALHSTALTGTVNTAMGGYGAVFRIYLTFLAPLVVAITGIVLVYRVTIGFIKTYYDQPNANKILSLIQRRLVGVPPLPPPLTAIWKYPYVVIRSPKDLEEDHWVRWMGGPAILAIHDGIALYLERGNKFSRVVGPGKPPLPFLDRFETVKAVIDLRPQVKKGEIRSWTKDGIELKITIRMECQIDSSEGARLASQKLVYPFDPLAIKRAAEFTRVRSDLKTKALVDSDWIDGVWEQVTQHINQHISSHSTDEIALSGMDNNGQGVGNLHIYKLTQDHIQKINEDLKLQNTGAQLLSIQIMMKFPPEVEGIRIRYWEAERAKQIATNLGKAEADGIRARESAHARAEGDMLSAITEKLKGVDKENLTEPLLLSLVGILDNSLDDPLIRPIIAKNSLVLLEQLRKALKERF